MIDLLQALNKIDLNPSAEELADMIWLISQISKKIPSSKPDVSFNQETKHKPEQQADSPKIEKSDFKTPKTKIESNEEVVSLFSKSSSETTSTETKGDAINVPTVRFLANSLQISRALRPLMRRVASKTNKILDENETIHQLAETNVLNPILKPALERGFNLTLIIDGNSSMVIWEPIIAEFQLLLERQGAFQDVKVFTLITDNENGSVKLCKRAKHKTNSLVLINPKELIDASKNV